MGSPGLAECRASLKLAESTCKMLGVPLALEKQEGPSYQLVFLGIQFDTANLELWLPTEKLERLSTTVKEWQGK